ncbi:PIN domain-containing protein [Phenylobacterium sp.]|uniref:PIN domain-containing protein n=1 Tax=Phenylobacterium sp. TaxID=1871053 RepID=UPI004036900E
MIVLDATAFMLLVHPDAQPPVDPKTGELVSRVPERFSFLEEEVQRSGDTILIPTPALAEVLVGLEDAGPAVIDRLSRSARFKIADFDTVAAVELAAMTREAVRAGDKRAGVEAPWQKVKIDRQIIAIAKSRGAAKIYSDDDGIMKFGSLAGIDVVPTWLMPLPPISPQAELFEDM